MSSSPTDRVLIEQRFSVGTTNDIVVLTLGTHTIRLFYQTALEIAAAMRLAAKMGMRYEASAATRGVMFSAKSNPFSQKCHTHIPTIAALM